MLSTSTSCVLVITRLTTISNIIFYALPSSVLFIFTNIWYFILASSGLLTVFSNVLKRNDQSLVSIHT